MDKIKSATKETLENALADLFGIQSNEYDWKTKQDVINEITNWEQSMIDDITEYI